MTMLAIIPMAFMAQIPMPQYHYINDAIQKSDYVGLARYVGGEGSYDTLLGGKPEFPATVYRNRFSRVLDLQGSIPSRFVAVTDFYRGETDYIGTQISPGTLVFLYLTRPDSNGRIFGHQTHGDYLTMESSSQYYLAGMSYGFNAYCFADGQYQVRGSNVLERLGYIAAQSFGLSKKFEDLWAFTSARPDYPTPPNSPLFDSYRRFYKDQVIPILNGAIEGDTQRKLQVAYVSADVLKGEYVVTQKALIRQVDREYQDADARMLFYIPIEEAFAEECLTARMSWLRAEGARALPSKIENKVRIIRMFTDQSPIVRGAVIAWLQTFAFDNHMEPMPPLAKTRSDGSVENEAAIREFWGG
ncbi:MAG TPA: hypothetical protein VFG65_04965 [Fimbriimonadales bacterium]|nr:hypothetical protein [Fimbriimonadales bacterium]